MTYVVRFYGKRIEPKLWKQWNGAPSLRFLRRDDLTIAKDIRKMKRKGKLDLKVINDTDHVFTLLWSQQCLIDLIYQWVSKKKWDKIN